MKLIKHVPELVAAYARVLISNRDLPSIKTHLTDAIVMEAGAWHQDIELYAKWRLDEESDIDTKLVTGDIREALKIKLIEQTNGS